MTSEHLDRVGVRELRQNLSVYLRRVKGGVTLEVTEHGHPVARLTPLPAEDRDELDRLIAEGRATPPVRALEDVLPLSSPIDARTERAVQRELRREREDRF